MFHLEGLLEKLWLFLRCLRGFGFLKIFYLAALGLTCGTWGLCCSMWDFFFFLSCSMQNLQLQHVGAFSCSTWDLVP